MTAGQMLGAVCRDGGVYFSIFSQHAEKIELCLFDSPDAGQESRRVELTCGPDKIWSTHVPGLQAGQLYGYRIYGPYAPEKGHRFNPHKVVLDPYALGIGRTARWNENLFGYRIGDKKEDLSFDERDNAADAPLAVVIDRGFDWGEDRHLKLPWNQTIIYETHVKGTTALHPDVPENLRGTYAGLASEPVIRHLKELGVTAIELMPIHHHAEEPHLEEKGLKNYWGYNTLAYFAPDIKYGAAGHPQEVVYEFKNMVRAFHAAGIEVILDVVYNHTAEGNHLGPTLSLRGIDNLSYYRTVPDKLRFYQDFTGCGNTLNMQHPRALALVLDSLRYWVEEMHVDGFRFDLASALARELFDVNMLHPFFKAIREDPVFDGIKMIAEPWDIGEGGYQVGNFPAGWAEWNGKYRDAVRRFWKGDRETVNEFATRFCGSSDLYGDDGRKPHASINFITAHDGFTLRDLVSYNEKHNEANQENNQDGSNDNFSYNWGAEGASDDPIVVELRARIQRNFMMTLFLSQGVPMLLGGDEFGRTQGGNNNAYCQDNEISWVDWNLKEDQKTFLAFVKRIIHFRQQEAAFRRDDFYHGHPIRGGDLKDISWWLSTGREMTEESWNNPTVHAFGVCLADHDNRFFYLIFNPQPKTVRFGLPEVLRQCPFRLLFDTAHPERSKTAALKRYDLAAHAMAVFEATPPPPAPQGTGT